MHRTHVQLTDDQLAALRAFAAAQHRSVSDLIRESVDCYVERVSPDRAALMERAAKAAGQFASGLTDVSPRHDDYLGEDFR
jgi:predicted transcriptional regulator